MNPSAARGFQWKSALSVVFTFVLAFLIAASLTRTPLHSEDAQTHRVTPEIFGHCIDGIESAAEAQQVGLLLGQHFYDLRFDSSILSPHCADQIAASTFHVYDASISAKLVKFLWNSAALREFLKASSTASSQLTCDITCLLVMDRRPLPDLSLFHELAQNGSRPPTAKIEFLLARTLFTKETTSSEQISGLIGSVGEVFSKDDIVKNLFLLASAEFAKGTFRRQGDQLCVGDRCVDAPDLDAGTDCARMTERFGAPRNLDEAIGLKAWMLGTGRNDVYTCAKIAFGEPLEKIQSGLARALFELSVFNPALNFVDVVTGFRSDLFKKDDFLDGDLLQLSRLDLSRVQSASWNFAEAIVEQLEPQASIPVPPNLRSLIDQTTSSARLNVLSCRREHPSATDRNAICDRRQIYLSAINPIIR
ncbi:MAG TPA: hypothetical protein VLR92_03690 [Blastocatellia bacterium]|nr:hypothetical protein [Blastocatellia bacterium]